MGRAHRSYPGTLDYQTSQDLPQGLVTGWGVQEHGPAHFTIQGLLTFLLIFVFSPKSRRDPISQTVWYGIAARAKTFNMCYFWQTEPALDPNWDNLVKFESKYEWHKKSSQNKQLTQETGHILHPSIQREVDFHSPFLPSDWTILSWFFPLLHRKDSRRWDKG